MPERISHGSFRRPHRLGNPAEVCRPSSFDEGPSLPVSELAAESLGVLGGLVPPSWRAAIKMSLLSLPSCPSPTLMWMPEPDFDVDARARR